MGRHSAPVTAGTAARRRIPVLVAAAVALATIGSAQAGATGGTRQAATVAEPQTARAVPSGTRATPTARASSSAQPGASTRAPQRVSRAQRADRADVAATAAPQPSEPPTGPVVSSPGQPAARATATPTATGRVAGDWVRPNDGPYNSCFCARWGTFHYGIDLAGKLGSPIFAVGDGVVLAAGPADGFGNWVVIQHANGDVSIYGHMRYFSVHAGEKVTAGEQIALVGAEGDVTGPHLHFGVRIGGFTGPYTDPVPWLAARGVQVGPYLPGS